MDAHIAQYRKMNRENIMRFTIQSNTNYTDSKLKFKRNLMYFLKQIYLRIEPVDRLSGKGESEEKVDAMMENCGGNDE